MSRTIRYKLNSVEEKYVLDFVNQLGQISLEQVAKVALLRSIDQAYRQAQQMADKSILESVELQSEDSHRQAQELSKSTSIPESSDSHRQAQELQKKQQEETGVTDVGNIESPPQG